jgi:hypothetical protein
MSATSSSTAFSRDQRRAPRHGAEAVIHRRRSIAVVLTAFALALGAVLVAAYGRDGLVLYFSQLVVGLSLLWLSTPATRFDESGEGRAST